MELNAPLTTAVLAGALLILQQVLMMTVGFRRIATQAGVGHKDDAHLERLVRRHGNLAENAAIILLVLGLLEAIGGSTTLLMSFAIAFFIARLLHAIGFSSLAGAQGGELATGPGRKFLLCRSIGAMTTAFVGFAAGGYLVWMALRMLIAQG